MKNSILLIFLFLSFSSFAQVIIQGTVKDSGTKETLPYCSVSIVGTGQRTITNADGAFIIRDVKNSDTAIFTYMGYNARSVPVSTLIHDPVVFLDARVMPLDEVVISANDDLLYEIMDKCRKEILKDHVRQVAKVYYGLETRTHDQPVELLECYYNGYTNGPFIDHLALKNGRIGLAGVDNRYFLSLNTSKAITGMSLVVSNSHFPAIPLQYGAREMKKYFSLSMAYNDEHTYRINFTGRGSRQECFTGNAWIDRVSFELLKIELEVQNSSRYPFIPIFPCDSISNVNLYISQTFRHNADSLFPDHISFGYSFTYKSVRDTPTIAVRSVIIRELESKGVIYFYDYGQPFILPFFKYDNDYDDYRKISIIPYNEFFWKNADPLLLTEKQKQDLGFMTNEGYLVNYREGNFGNDFLKSDQGDSALNLLKSGFYENYYTFWSSESRIRLNRQTEQNEVYSGDRLIGSIPSNLYRLKVQVFLDVTIAGDSLDTRSYTVFDAAETFYHLPEEPWTNAFLNIYFDICEIERRKMQKELDSGRHSLQEVEEIYNRTNENIDIITKEYQKEVQTGRNTEKLAKWNKYVQDELGIDNLK